MDNRSGIATQVFIDEDGQAYAFWGGAEAWLNIFFWWIDAEQKTVYAGLVED